MSLVLDASVVLAWLLDEPSTGVATRARAAILAEPVAVPSNWPLEVANGLLMAARSRRLTEVELAAGMRAVLSLPVAVDPGGVGQACGVVAALARQHGLTAYDAAYLELAVRLGLPLATADQDLARAAQEAGAALL